MRPRRVAATLMDNDYYKVLGVGRDASQPDIERAYRKMARKYHPDMNPDDRTAKEKFQKVQQAYDVLNDPEKREMYDRYGSSFEQFAGGRAHPGGPGGTGGVDVDFSQIFGQRGGGGGAGFDGGFADLFEQFTRAGAARSGGRKAARRGANLETEVQVPFATAVLGGDTQLSLMRSSGKVVTATVKIPEGHEDGAKIRLRGQGEPGANGPPGDLLITVHVAPHPFFRRKGNHLEVDLPVTLAEAALGAKVDIPTPKGVISLGVPRGTSSGQRLRAKGLGVKSKSGGVGDLHAIVQIVLPPAIDDRAAELIRELDQRLPHRPRMDLKW